MPTLTITKADPSGGDILLAGTVDEGAAGLVTYTAVAKIADVLAATTAAARLQVLFAALEAARQDALDRRTKLDNGLANAIGKTKEIA